MGKIERFFNLVKSVGICLFFTISVSTGGAIGQAAEIDPQAENLLRSATSYLAQQQKLSVEAQGTLEAVLTSGQKIQFDHSMTMSMQRPDRLRVERSGELVDQIFYYDGKSLTLFNPDTKHYATLPAPETVEKMLDFARESLDIVAPAGDLLYANAFEILMQDVTSGFVVGRSMLGGVVCTHLAFRAPHVDWQIWIQDGDQPLPRKFVITSPDIAGAPQFTVVMTGWNLAPELTDGMFEFKPAADAKQIEFLPADGGAASSR